MPYPYDCPTCGELGGGEIANTGRGEYLSGAWSKLQRLNLGNRLDLGICPQCASIVEWTDHPQCYGSGNLDEEHLRRIEEPELGLVRTFLRAGEDPHATLAALAPALAGGIGEDLLVDLLRWLVYKQRSTFRLLLPTLVGHLYSAPRSGYGDALGNYMFSSHVRSREIVALIEADPRPQPFAVEHLLQKCRKQLATPE